MSSWVVSFVVRNRSPVFWKPYPFPSSGIHVILFPDAEEIRKRPATAVHFSFVLMSLVYLMFDS